MYTINYQSHKAMMEPLVEITMNNKTNRKSAEFVASTGTAI